MKKDIHGKEIKDLQDYLPHVVCYLSASNNRMYKLVGLAEQSHNDVIFGIYNSSEEAYEAMYQLGTV
jgi:hypothetical protein